MGEPGPSPRGDEPAGFVYDFGTLFDYVEREATACVKVTLDPDTPAHRIVVCWAGGEADEPVADANFDAAAARLAPRLQDRGLVP